MNKKMYIKMFSLSALLVVFALPEIVHANSVGWGTTGTVWDTTVSPKIGYNISRSLGYVSNASKGGVALVDGDTLKPGDVIDFSTPFEDTQSSWFILNSFSDSPYGSWTPGFGKCFYAKTLPTVTVSGTGLSCTGTSCTVTGTGPITAAVSFSSVVTNTNTQCPDGGWTYASTDVVVPVQTITHSFTSVAPPTVNLYFSYLFNTIKNLLLDTVFAAK